MSMVDRTPTEIKGLEEHLTPPFFCQKRPCAKHQPDRKEAVEQYERAVECYQNRQSSLRPDKGAQTQQPCDQATQGMSPPVANEQLPYSSHISLF